MRYRALFVGGPLDGQEKVLMACPIQMNVLKVQYNLVWILDEVIVYSTTGLRETMEWLWADYTGGRYASDCL